MLVTLLGQPMFPPTGSWIKYSGNPILLPQGQGFESRAVFNPAAIVRDHSVYLLYRAQDRQGVSRIGLARSRDGLHFERLAQ
ncbi:MAG TPA: glycosylase, partial [Candidatus Fraserbacteria bacterium]|nr:glycosylase [Candidatus Fraserbacteria bacterium]